MMDAPNETVYFKITNVEHEMPRNGALDGFSSASLGEWGCWVDHSVTRIVQTGVEQSRVPTSTNQGRLTSVHYRAFNDITAISALAC
jgi:peroxin-6